MPSEEGARRDPLPETEYLDLDGDGVPDAVVTTRVHNFGEPDGAEVTEVTEELDANIGVDGVPQTVTVTDIVEIDTNHDGLLEIIKVSATERERAPSPADGDAVS